MEGTFSLMDIVKTLKKRWNLILLTTLLAGLIGMIVSFYILKPVYEASTQILVNQNSSDAPIDIRLLQGNVDLINTYSVIIKSPAILEKVIDTLNLKQSVAELNENLIIKSQENSQVFTLVVEDREAAEAVKIANAVSEIFQKEIPNIMNVNNVSILAKAELNEKPVPVKPNALLNIAISTAAGLLAGIAFSLVLDLLDNTLRDDKDVAVYLGLPVLGSIKEISKNDIKGMEKSVSQKLGSETIGQLVEKKVNKKVKLISYHNLKSPITEQYRLIRNNLHFASVDKEIKTIAITSPEPSDGKSTTSANLAIVLAQQGKQVLLVDGDLRKPSIHYTFNVSNIDGLTTVLTKDIALVEAISKTHIPNLDILSSGSIPPNPSELLNSKSMEIIMDELKILYDYIIFDTPPILLVTESQIMASKCNGVILVIASGKTKKEKAMKAKELLEQANSQILGVVVNGVKAKGDFYSSDYYG